jgi:hypothetical protein
MIIPEDLVPRDLDEAVNVLKSSLTEDELKEMKRTASVSTHQHHGWGTNIRNAWSLWDKTTTLPVWFEKTYGVSHADDISGIILECLWSDVRNEPRKDKELAAEYIQHWKEMKREYDEQ